MIRALAILAALLTIPCACTVVAAYLPIWIGIRLGWWR